MVKIKSRKVSDSGVDGFSETVKFHVLACGNITGNNNKFYCIELQKNPMGKYRLFTHYGRIGKTNVYEVRDTVTDQYSLETEMGKIIKKKKNHKKTPYETVDTQEPSVGSDNIRGVACSTGASTTGDLKMLSLFDGAVRTMVKNVWEENIHNITNLTTMKVSSSGISSPLGPLTLSHIEDAVGVLSKIKDAYQLDPLMGVTKSLNNRYFSMIPHPFGMSIPSDALIDDDNKFMVEYDLLEQMKSVLKVSDDKDDEPVEDIGVDIDLLSSPTEWDSLERKYIDSRASCHSHLNGWNIKQIFKVNHKQSTKNYKDLGQKEYILFHGSRACNILSILINGLMIPPSTAGHVTGRMFGDGIYGASASTKALNYATGYWGGGRSKHRQAYMFVVEFAMGDIYYPTGAKYNGPPQGFDSIWARKEKTNLVNDEFIVYNLNQARITHLLQLQER